MQHPKDRDFPVERNITAATGTPSRTATFELTAAQRKWLDAAIAATRRGGPTGRDGRRRKKDPDTGPGKLEE